MFLLVLFFLIAVQGCSLKNKDRNLSNESKPNEMQMTGVTSTSVDDGKKKDIFMQQVEPNHSAFNRMVIKRGTINIEIEGFSDAEKTITDEVSKAHGFITNTSSSVNATGKKQGTIEVRVPAENYDSFVSSLNAVGKVMSQNISGNDVTEEYIDLEARQLTQRELEKRLLNLLSERTAKLTDVVEVEQKLSEVRQSIEAAEGRLRYLKNQSEFSTLAISLFEPSLIQTSSGGGFFYEVGEAFRRGITGFTEVLTALITFVISILPVLILLAAAVVIIKKFVSNIRKKRQQLQVSSR